MGKLVATSVVVVALLAASAAEALTKCKGVVRRKDGVVLIQANDAQGALSWGTDPNAIDQSFFVCAGTSTAPRRCTLGPAGSLSERTPPSDCNIHLSDGLSADCSAYIKGCTPGVRPTDSSVPAGDPRGEEGATLDAIQFIPGGGAPDGARSLTPTEDTILFTGVNVQIIDGSGTTGGPPTGVGNLIIGYNEDTGFGSPHDRTGSHNLVIGEQHTFSGWSGIVAGRLNTIGAAYASVTAGYYNRATGKGSSVTGGRSNRAYGNYSSISAGYFHQASGWGSSVSGGTNNTAYADYASVSGGYMNRAYGYASSISGGTQNYTTANVTSISGGSYDLAAANNASISGGHANYGYGQSSSILGGYRNTTASNWDTIGGGYYNRTYGNYASVSGGQDNQASGYFSVVSGGRSNRAYYNHSTVSGGYNLYTTSNDEHLP
jgi:hypothetical protein